jgi:hypothetical protein
MVASKISALAVLVMSLLTTAGPVFGGALYTEGFEQGFGAWNNTVDDDFNWTLKAGNTASWKTGPDTAHSGYYYIYTESSSSSHPYKTANIVAEFDLSDYSSPNLSFYYHMHGGTMGTLAIDLYDGSWRTNHWSISSQRHTSSTSSWTKVEVDISQLHNQSNAKIRFRGTTGASFTSDMAIDQIQIYDDVAFLDHFSWNFIPTEQWDGQLFSVIIKAKNSSGNILTTFNQAATLSGWSPGTPSPCLNGNFSNPSLSPWLPLNQGDDPGPYDLRTYTINYDFNASPCFNMTANTGSRDGIFQEVTLLKGEQYTLSMDCLWKNQTATHTNTALNVVSAYINESHIASANFSMIRPNVNYIRSLAGTYTAPSNGVYTLKLTSYTSEVQPGIQSVYMDNVKFNFTFPGEINVTPQQTALFINGVCSLDLSVLGRVPVVSLKAEYGRFEGDSNDFSTFHSVFDSDNDGILDSWENTYFGSPTNCDGEQDLDKDGQSNRAEYIAGTHPGKPSSLFKVAIQGNAETGNSITWDSIQGRTYDVEYTSNLKYIPFQSIQTDMDYPQESFIDIENTNAPTLFYRLKVRRQ